MTAKKGNDAHIARKVAARFISAGAVPMGATEDKGKIRVKRFRDNLRIWDLTNAGKRGKKVSVMFLAPNYGYKGDVQGWLDRMSTMALDYGNYSRFKAMVADMADDFPGEIEMSESQSRGIDVLPADVRTIKLKWSVGDSNMQLMASPLEFVLRVSALISNERGRAGEFRQDTIYAPVKKADAKKFYAWLANGGESKIKKMDVKSIRKLWDALGVRYNYH